MSSLRPSRLLRPGGRLLDPELLTQSPDRPVKIVLDGGIQSSIFQTNLALLSNPLRPPTVGGTQRRLLGFLAACERSS